MCGNDISVIADPNELWRNQLQKQIQHGEIVIVNRPISLTQALFFSKCDTQRLKSLEIVDCNMCHQILDEMLKNNFMNLEKLVLNGNRVGAAGCKVIASCASLKNLKCLEMNGNHIHDAGARELENANFTSLEDLSLNNNQLTEAGVARLKKFSEVIANKLDDKAIDTIQDINPKGFIFMRLSKNNFTNKALESMMGLKRLEVLLIDRNKVDKERKELKAADNQFIFY